MKKYQKLINVLLILITNTMFNYHIPTCSDIFTTSEKNKLLATFYTNSVLLYDRDTGKMKISSNNDIKTINQLLSATNYKNYYVFDKIIGKSNAILYAKNNIQCLYGRIITESGKKVLDRYSIKYEAEKIISDKMLNKNNNIAISDRKIKNINDYNKAYQILLNE